MASTYTQNSGIELIGDGEQSGEWGDTTNLNLEIIDRLANGVGAISLSGTTHTLETLDGTLSDGHYAVFVFGGTPTGTNTVTLSPDDQQKFFAAKNNSGQTVVLTQGTGGDVSLPDGNSAFVYADGLGSGASVVDLTATFQISGALLEANNLSDLDDSADALVNLGLTATAAELNILDGATVTTAEINYNDIAALGTSEDSKVVTADSNGNIKLSEEVQARAYIETGVALSGTTPSIPCNEANTFVITTSGNTTFTFDYSGVQLTTSEAYAFTLRVTAGGTHTLTWPTTVNWAGGEAPDAPASGETDVLVFFTTTGGSTWYGFQAGDAMG